MPKKSPVDGMIAYLKDVRGELSKVTWPDRTDIIRLTLIVLIFSGIVAIYLGGLDFMFTKLLETIIAR